jgi:hypothetical protein
VPKEEKKEAPKQEEEMDVEAEDGGPKIEEMDVD